MSHGVELRVQGSAGEGEFELRTEGVPPGRKRAMSMRGVELKQWREC